MSAVTYSDKKVMSFINDKMIPLQIPPDNAKLATEFRVKWTPTIIFLDKEGQEHHRIVGFEPPDEFIPLLMLGISKIHYDRDDLKEALPNLEKIISDFPRSHSAPEAVYLAGVIRFKMSGDVKHLKEAYGTLKSRYPESEWTKRAFPYEKL